MWHMQEESAKNKNSKRMGNRTIDALSLEETTQIIHDLHIHQAELEARGEDISKAQGEITRLRRDYADLFDITPIGLFLLCGKKGLIEKVNRFGASLLSTDKQLIEGKPFLAFVDSEFAPMFLDHLSRAESTKERQVLELELKKFGGQTFPAECDTMPFYGENGKFLYFRMVVTNIKDRKQNREAMVEKMLRL
jgi:PAS domain-containing protein